MAIQDEMFKAIEKEIDQTLEAGADKSGESKGCCTNAYRSIYPFW